MNFEFILVVLVGITGLIIGVDRLFFAPERKVLYGAAYPKHPNDKSVPVSWIIEYAYAFFPILLIVLFLRSFIIEPFRIPSGSLKPTLLDGDFIFVNKFAYGLRLPLIYKKILPLGTPERGDIAVFRWPMNTRVDYIKRIVGLPGDRISYLNKVLYINGKPMKQSFIKYSQDSHAYDRDEHFEVALKKETLGDVTHDIYLQGNIPPQNFSDVEVPKGNYFAMGDNRDDSKDSRAWGFVPDQDLAGQAFIVWFSWDSKAHRIRWERIGMRIH